MQCNSNQSNSIQKMCGFLLVISQRMAQSAGECEGRKKTDVAAALRGRRAGVRGVVRLSIGAETVGLMNLRTRDLQIAGCSPGQEVKQLQSLWLIQGQEGATSWSHLCFGLPCVLFSYLDDISHILYVVSTPPGVQRIFLGLRNF